MPINWYRNYVRPFFARWLADRIPEYDREAKNISKLEEAIGDNIPVCFLGNSGIGKSTLINALVAGDQVLLPSGGIGPLTAQALTVSYGDQRSFEVSYHTKDRVNRLIFALENIHRAQRKRSDGELSEPIELPEELVIDSDEAETLGLEIDQDLEDVQSRNNFFRGQAALMVTGRQDSDKDLTYLIDRLCSAININTRYDTDCSFQDDLRISGLKSVIERGRKKEVYRCVFSNDGAFEKELAEHASGYVAPMIESMKVRWDSDLLKACIALTDLPGVGVAGDVNAAVTRTFIREKAKAVVLVVDTRGIHQETADLLHRSGFLNRLLFSFDDPGADPVNLIVAVVKVDNIADERRLQDRSKSKLEHFRDVCAESGEWIRNQVRGELEKVWTRTEGLSEEKRGVIDRIIDNLEIHPLSAIQYRRFLAQDEDDPWFIKTAEDSNVPGLFRSLEKLATDLRTERCERLEETKKVFFSNLTNQLQLVQSQWEEDRTSEEIEALRGDLHNFLGPLQQEFANRQGAYREFLKSTVPEIISGLVTKAGTRAEKDINGYLCELQGAHWATLRAAVRRGGAFYGARHINLPEDFALRFEEPVAEIWGKALLQQIRKKTKDYADDCVTLVERLVEWTKEQRARPSKKLLDAQTDLIKADLQQVNSVGKEAVNELREKIKKELIKKIETPIRKKCQNFVASKEDVGRGVKNRILELFEQLASDVIDAATEPAAKLLQIEFREVEKEIVAIFAEHQNPLDSLSHSIVSSHEDRMRKKETRVQTEVLDELKPVLENAPTTPA